MKRVIVLALCLVGLIAVAIASIPFLVSTDLAKRRIAEEIARWTGRSVSFTGEPHVSFFPHISVELSAISLGNPQDMDGGQFLGMDAVVGRVRILPLFLGRTEIAEFQLVHPRLALRIDAAGRSNWKVKSDGSSPPDRADRKAGNVAAKPPPDPSVRLGRFVIRGGSITYDDERSGKHEIIDGIDVNFAWPSTSSPAAGSGHFIWHGETVDFNAAVGAPMALMTGSLSPLRFAFATTPIRMSFSGTGLDLSDMQLTGDTSITTPSIRRLMAWLGKPIGEGPTLGAAAISGKLTWVKPAAAFANVRMELDGNQAEGAISATFGDKPKIEGTLALTRLDLSAYLEAFTSTLSASGPWRSAPVRLPLNASDLDLRLSAGEIIAGSARTGRAAAAVNIDDGKFTLTVGEAQFYGGHAEARLSAAMNGDALEASGEAKLDEVPTRAALGGLIGLDRLDGSGTLSVDLAARGKTWGELAASASGTAKVSIADGRLTGVDVVRLAELASNPAAMSDPSGATAFNLISGSFTMADGSMRSDDLRAEGSGYAVTLGGKVSLRDETVQAEGTLTTSRPDSPGQPARVPFAVNGTFGVIAVVPDFGRLPKRSAAELKGVEPISAPLLELAPHG
jgi:AsmA protein